MKAFPCIGLVVVGLAVGGAAGAEGRAFPSTRERTRVFADQLPAQLTDAQRRFAATHYAGSQKQTVSWTRRTRALNPGYLMLHYQLAVGTGKSAFVEGDAWTNDFPSVSRHEDWFMRDADGRRILQTAWNWYVMDIRFDGQNPRTGFPAYWTKTAIRRMRMNEADGCFADSYTQDILMNQVKPAPKIFSDAMSNKREWLPHLNRYGKYVADAFHREPEQFAFLPNLGGQVTTWDTATEILVGDGGMIEGFATPGPDGRYSDDDWKLQMTRALNLARHGKILIAQTGVHPENTDHRWFVFGSYLLTRGPRSYLNMIASGTLEWYPEVTLDLGAYREDPRPDVMDTWKPEWRVFRRDFEKGFLLLNLSGESVTVADLGAEYRLVSATGGGAVGPDGAEPGRLSTTPTRSVTIPAYSARVLLLPPPAGNANRPNR